MIILIINGSAIIIGQDSVNRPLVKIHMMIHIHIYIYSRTKNYIVNYMIQYHLLSIVF